MENSSGIVSLDTFDSTIPSYAEQDLVSKCTGSVERESGRDDWVCEHTDVEYPVYIESRSLRLRVNGITESSPHHIADYDYPVSSAIYLYYPEYDVVKIGGIWVERGFQEFGIGTTIRKQMENNITQLDPKESFTWIASDGGEKLASMCGYEYIPDTDSPIMKKKY